MVNKINHTIKIIRWPETGLKVFVVFVGTCEREVSDNAADMHLFSSKRRFLFSVVLYICCKEKLVLDLD